MRLGYNTNGFASHALDDALTVIAEIGYRSVGLTLDHHALNPFAAESPARVAACARRLEALGLVAVVETGARFLLDPRRKHRPTLLDDEAEGRRRREAFLEQAIDIAADLGAPAVSFWSGAAPPAPVETLDDRLVPALERLAERAAARGIVLAMEPEPGMHVSTMADFDRVRARVPHPSLRLTLDVGHAHLTETEGAVATVGRYAPLLANAHLEGMQRPRHDHLLPWEGDMDLGSVLRAIVQAGYSGPATFELSRHSHDAVDVARRAFAFAQQALGA